MAVVFYGFLLSMSANTGNVTSNAASTIWYIFILNFELGVFGYIRAVAWQTLFDIWSVGSFTIFVSNFIDLLL